MLGVLFVALLAMFACSTEATNYRGGPFGKNGGSSFDDSIALTGNFGNIKSLEVFTGRLVDRIIVIYEDGTTFVHGGLGGGSRKRLDLQRGERIVKVDGRSGDMLDQIKFTTSKGRIFGPFGGNGGRAFSVDFRKTKSILQYLFGRSDRVIDQIGFGHGQPLAEPDLQVIRSASRGGRGGKPFDDFKQASQVLGRIKSITVRSGERIDSLSVTYEGANDGTFVFRRGGNGGR